jgi:hypothetical protein
MRRICLVLAAVFVLSVMAVTAAPAMADDHWRGGGNNWRGDKDWDHNRDYNKRDHHKRDHHKRDHDRWKPQCDWYWSWWKGWERWCWSPYHGWYKASRW